MPKKLSALLLASLLLCVSPGSAYAWGDPGHMVVSQIAFENLNPATRSRVNELAAIIRFQDRRYNFVSAACWMDDIRDEPAFEPIREWHFITLRFIVSGPARDEPPPVVNAVSILDWSIRTLRDPNARQPAKAHALAYLLHLTGDIHQPLHATTRYTDALPDGDRGGNLFPLAGPRPNLHSYWDSAGVLFTQQQSQRPSNPARSSPLRTVARSIMNAHPASSLPEASNLDPAEWARESHQLGRKEVYAGVTENSTPSNTYRNKVRDISRRRMALGGRRLANLLNDIFAQQ